MKYNTIVIGGGLAGLTAGAILSKFGKKVLLLEQHHKPGGCATTFKRGDFIVEVGLHEMGGLADDADFVKQIFNMLDVEQHVQFQIVPELYTVLSDKEDFVFPHGYEAATKALIARYPEDEKGIKKFMKVISGIRNGIRKLPKKAWVRTLIYPLMPLLYPEIVAGAKHTVGSWLDKHISNEKLKLDLAAHVVYYADDPYTLSLFYFGIAQAGYVSGGGHFIKGGSQQLSNYLASYIEENGGTVLLGKKAEKIVTQNGLVTGVTFLDSFSEQLESTTIACDNVVANCAIPLLPAMLDEPYASDLLQQVDSKTISCSLLSLYLGFNSDLKAFGVNHYSNFILGDDVKQLKDVHPNQLGDWSKRSFIFVDYGQIDSQLAPPGKSLGSICGVDYLKNWEGLSKDEYEARKEEVKEILLQRLEKQFPGIRGSIEYAEIATPKTIQRFTLNPQGTPYGFTQSKDQSAFKRFRNNFLLPNLYVASAWAFPGGGFYGTTMTGFLAALQMNQDEIWSTCDSDKFQDNRKVKLVGRKALDEKTLELSFDKPLDFQNQKGQYAILNLLNPKVTELDLPYRWLPIASNGKDSSLKFHIPLENSSFSKSCELLEEGEMAIVYGPMS